MRTLSHATIALALLALLPAAATADGPWSLRPAERLGTVPEVDVPDGEVPALPEPDPQDEDRDGERGEGQEDETPAPAIATRSKADVLARKVLAAHGGIDALNAFTSLQFTVTPVLIRPVEGGEPGAPTEFEEIRRAPIAFQANFSGEQRAMRMDEPIEIEGREHMTTKVLINSESGNDVHFLLDGNERSIIPEQREQITQDVQTLAGQFDILLGLGTGQLVGSYDGSATRDGVTYETVVAQFFGGMQREKTFRLYLNPETDLVDRYDLFDTDSRRLVNKLVLADHATYEGLQLPGSITFRNRRDVPFMRWEFTDYLVNEEIAPERFAVGDDDASADGR